MITWKAVEAGRHEEVRAHAEANLKSTCMYSHACTQVKSTPSTIVRMSPLAIPDRSE